MSEDVLQLSFRWTHLVAGTLWVGAGFLLAWGFAPLRRTAARLEDDARARLAAWLELASAVTWLAGASLLGLMYYSGRWPYLLETGVRPGPGDWGPALLGILAAAPLAELGARLAPRLRWAAPLALLVGALALAVWLETRGLSRRALHVHAGAFLATGMLAWLWRLVAPGLRSGALEPAERGVRHGARLSIPLLLLMVSVDQPILTGYDPWPLGLFAVLAAGYALALTVERGLED